jgi:hypothetical protein
MWPISASSWPEVVRALERAGWHVHRVRGSHHVLKAPDGRRTPVKGTPGDWGQYMATRRSRLEHSKVSSTKPDCPLRSLRYCCAGRDHDALSLQCRARAGSGITGSVQGPGARTARVFDVRRINRGRADECPRGDHRFRRKLASGRRADSGRHSSHHCHDGRRDTERCGLARGQYDSSTGRASQAELQLLPE